MNDSTRIPGHRFLHSPGPSRVPDEVLHDYYLSRVTANYDDYSQMLVVKADASIGLPVFP